jgi:hypothetical protein
MREIKDKIKDPRTLEDYRDNGWRYLDIFLAICKIEDINPDDIEEELIHEYLQNSDIHFELIKSYVEDYFEDHPNVKLDKVDWL